MSLALLPAAGSAERRRLYWLGGVVVVLLGYLWYSQRPAEPVGVASNPVGPTQRTTEAGPIPLPETVRLGGLEDVPVLEPASRNPFGYGERPLPPAPPVVAVVRPPVPVVAPVVPMVPTGPPPPPPIALRLVARTVPVEGGRPVVTLKDPATNAVYLAQEGEVIDGRYRVLKIGLESAVVAYLDGSGQRTIPLGG